MPEKNIINVGVKSEKSDILKNVDIHILREILFEIKINYVINNFLRFT